MCQRVFDCLLSVLKVHSYPCENVHQQQHARSYANLDKAQADAKWKNGYDWQQTRDNIPSIFHKHFGTDPYSWQLDVTEAILLGLDSVVIAGMGSSKTMPFMMPLLLDKKKQAIIISPLKVLQEDQVSNSSYIYLLNLYGITGCTIQENGDRHCSRKWRYLVLRPAKGT